MTLVWSGWGALVPVFAAGGLLVSDFVMRQAGVAPQWTTPTGLVMAGLVAGVGLFLATRKIEGTGCVFCGADGDCPVVVAVTAGRFGGISLKAWSAILPALGLAGAALSYLLNAPGG